MAAQPNTAEQTGLEYNGRANTPLPCKAGFAQLVIAVRVPVQATLKQRHVMTASGAEVFQDKV